MTRARIVPAMLLFLALPSSVRGEAPPPDIGDQTVRDPAGASVRLSRIAAEHRFTVVVFYSSSCRCFAAHVPRLGQLAFDFAKQGVTFLAVDSERHDASEPPPPIAVATGVSLFRDEGGVLARYLHARFATQAFVIDRAGKVRYDGGLDSERKYVTATARMYLRDVLVGLLGSDAPRYATTKSLGCALRLL